MHIVQFHCDRVTRTDSAAVGMLLLLLIEPVVLYSHDLSNNCVLTQADDLGILHLLIRVAALRNDYTDNRIASYWQRTTAVSQPLCVRDLNS